MNPLDYSFLESVTITDDPLLTLFEFMRAFYEPTEDSSIYRILHADIFNYIDLVKIELKRNHKFHDDAVNNQCYISLLGYIAGDAEDRKLFQQAFVGYTYRYNDIRFINPHTDTDRVNLNRINIMKYRKILFEINFNPNQFRRPLNHFFYQGFNWRYIRTYSSEMSLEKSIYQKQYLDIEKNLDPISFIARIIDNRSDITASINITLELISSVMDPSVNPSIENVRLISNEWFPKYVISDKYTNYVGILKYLFLNIMMLYWGETQDQHNASSFPDDVTKMYKLVIKIGNPPFHEKLERLGVYDYIKPANLNTLNIRSQVSSYIGSLIGSDTNKTLDSTIYIPNPENDDLLNDILS